MIVENISKLCKERGTYFAKLERELGMGNGTISKWSTCSPVVANIKAVADYFGVTVDDLLKEAEEK